MLKKGKPQPNVLPGADPQVDCQTPEEITIESGAGTDPEDPTQDREHDDGHDHDVTWRDVGVAESERPGTIADWIPQRAGWTIF